MVGVTFQNLMNANPPFSLRITFSWIDRMEFYPSYLLYRQFFPDAKHQECAQLYAFLDILLIGLKSEIFFFALSQSSYQSLANDDI